MTETILLVEDERDIAFPLGRTLEREGYAVAWVANGGEALDVVDDGPVDVVILDLSLPDMDGVELCRTLRQSGFAGGIVMMTARVGELDVVLGLDSGADDYIRKPFGLAELLARVRAILRRIGRHGHAATSLPSPLRMDVEGRRAHAGEAELHLTNKEFGVLRVLMSHRGKVVTRERLMSEVWDEHWHGTTKTLDVTMGRLRAKLEEAGVPDRIMAIRGVGFRLEHPAHAN